METPSNPLLRITDIAAAAELAHSSAGKRTVVAVDNTFCSPILQQPLSLDADLVIASDTKFLNGHSDVIGGSVGAANQQDVDLIAFHANMMGTLGVRMQAHCANAARMVEILQSHQAVTAVYWPGLPNHPGHELAARQQKNFESLLSFELAGGRASVEAFMTGLKGFILAESLGGVESLVCHPATMTHAAMSQEARDAAGVTDAMIRMSPGIDPVNDLAICLSEALDRATTV